MKKIIDWHRTLVEKAQKELELTNYQLYWSGFLEGALVLWIVMKVTSVVKGSPEFPFQKLLSEKNKVTENLQVIGCTFLQK